MRTLCLSIVLATLVGGGLAANRPAPQPLPDWERFRSSKDGFSVLFPEWPAVINRGQYRAAPVRGARSYAAYQQGVVYFVVAFENPNHENLLEHFLQSQLSMDELRNTEISGPTKILNGNSKGKQYAIRKSDYRKSFTYPGVLRLFEAKNRVLALAAVGKDETEPAVERFLQSFEIGDNPSGRDIGAGATYSESPESTDPSIKASETSRKVLVVIKAEPQYTEDERRRRLRGGVVLKGVFAASGRVTNLQVISGLPELAQSAMEVAHKIYFIPAVKDGRFISTFVELQYNFDIY